MGNNAKFQLSNTTKEKLKQMAREKAKQLATEARDRMSEEYLYIISNFYSEYEPQYYNRHFNNLYDENSLLNSGLGHTFEKYYKNSHNSSYSGGISISTENMYSDYNAPQIDVLNSFLNGYHGPAFLGIESSIKTYRHMVRFKELLIAEFTERLRI